jgi:formyltetrahydrofolate deformylase
MGVRYVHLPVDPGAKSAQEGEVIKTLADHGARFVVLARYMQILGRSIIEAHPHRIINIHHSFLPAFVGANPYRQAHQRGVKLIGATAHYATVDLDEGPIIEQDTAHVSHRDDVARLTARGRDLETIVLARAVRAHLEHRVLVYGNRTVVFS